MKAPAKVLVEQKASPGILVQSLSRVAKVAAIFGGFAQDAFAYVRYNGHSPFQPRAIRRFYKIIIEAHTIEKGLALESSRRLFGEAKIRQLIALLKTYDVAYSKMPAEMALGAIDQYLKVHRAAGCEDRFLDELEGFAAGYIERHGIRLTGGVHRTETGGGVDAEVALAFLETRHSHRTYQSTSVERSVLERAVTIAQRAPSQCNRQSIGVYLVESRPLIAALLNEQGGAKGFADQVSSLFVVSSDVAAWGGGKQRNQLYVDGGLFCMQLLLACHALGVATCPLNLAVSHAIEDNIRRLADIPHGQRLIMMIAAGYPHPDAKVANAPRRPLDEILHIR